jgi:hypothetical protein
LHACPNVKLDNRSPGGHRQENKAVWAWDYTDITFKGQYVVLSGQL